MDIEKAAPKYPACWWAMTMSNLDRLVTLERVGEATSPPGPGSYPFSPIARLDVDTISTTRRTAWARRFDARLSR